MQAIASGPATLRRAARLRGAPVSSSALVEAWRERERWAQTAVGESARGLAALVTSLTEIRQPALVQIGGGFATAVAGFTATSADNVERLARPGQRVPPIRPAVLGGLSSLRGATLLAQGLA